MSARGTMSRFCAVAVVAVAYLSGLAHAASPPPAPSAPKGWLMFSWNSEACKGMCFAILSKTNRTPAIDEIRSAKLTLADLKRKLGELKKGEEIEWTSRLDATEFVLPQEPGTGAKGIDPSAVPVFSEGKRLGLKITVTAPPHIGVATMAADGTINMQLRSLPPGPIAEAFVSYPPSHPKYQEMLEHLGELRPGGSKFIAPFPEEPEKK